MDPFCYDDLSLEEKLYLSSLVRHPGFTVMKKMLENACQQATVKVIKLKRENERYKELLEAYQTEAHITNDVCATLLKSITMHAQAGDMQEKAEQLQKELELAGVSAAVVKETGIGSIKTKNVRTFGNPNQ
jgi:biotin synthase-related radical SAM superfamily protein